MLKTIIGTALAGSLLMTVPASADRDHRGDRATGSERISTEAMAQKINDLGYDVRRLEFDDGEYEAQIVERESGGVVKARFDSKDGELIRAEPHP
jgi:hypothetical protein